MSTEVESIRDGWCTPPRIVKAILRLWPDGADLDPCTNDNAIVPARVRVALPDDGLAMQWSGRVFVNPPYSNPEPWAKRCSDACDEDGCEVIGLFPCDPSTGWFRYLWEASAICFLNFRVQFIPPPGVKASSNRGASAIAYWGPDPDRFAWAFGGLGKVKWIR